MQLKKAKSQSGRCTAQAMMILHGLRLVTRFSKNIHSKHTHTHSHTKKSWTSDGLKLYLNIAGQNGKEFSHHRERHIEYTVYVQTQFWTKYNFTVASRTMTTNCKPSLTKGNEQKTTTAIQILLK